MDKKALAACAQGFICDLKEGMTEDEIPEDIAHRVQRLQKENGWGREQWKRFVCWSKGGPRNVDDSTVRDPNRLKKKQCLELVIAMAQSDFWSDTYAQKGEHGYGGRGGQEGYRYGSRGSRGSRWNDDRGDGEDGGPSTALALAGAQPQASVPHDWTQGT